MSWYNSTQDTDVENENIIIIPNYLSQRKTLYIRSLRFSSKKDFFKELLERISVSDVISLASCYT